jgi:hypothetical protein
MKFNLKRFLPFLYRTRFHVQPEHEVELAFTHQGIDYYTFTNSFDMASARYATAQDAINTLEMKVTKDQLLTYTSLIDEYVNKGKLSLISVVNHNLKERINHVCNEELFLQLAAIFYFDKTENCYVYNFEYGAKKIDRWRGDLDLLSFFFKGPIGRFLPLTDTFISLIPTYSKAQKLEEISMLKFHLSLQQETPSNAVLISTIQSKILLLENLLNQAE